MKSLPGKIISLKLLRIQSAEADTQVMRHTKELAPLYIGILPARKGIKQGQEERKPAYSHEKR